MSFILTEVDPSGALGIYPQIPVLRMPRSPEQQGQDPPAKRWEDTQNIDVVHPKLSDNRAASSGGYDFIWW